MAAPSEIVELASDREPVIVLTAPWHERDTRSMVERLPVEFMLPTHGAPTDRAAVERALA